MFNEPSYFKTGKSNMNSVLCVADVGVRRFVPDKFVFGVLGFGDLGFWAWEEFWGQIVTDSLMSPLRPI